MENMINVINTSNWTVTIDVPDLQLRKTWSRQGATQKIMRDTLVNAFYNSVAVETLFTDGTLYTDDKQFMVEVGLMVDDVPTVIRLDDNLMKRLIKLMPMSEFNKTVEKLTKSQMVDLADYAVSHWQDLAMDRIEPISKLSGKNIFKAIDNFKQSQEG